MSPQTSPAASVPASTLTVALGERSYPIHCGPGLLDRGDLVRAGMRGRRALLVSSESVAALGYPQRLRSALADAMESAVEPELVVLPDGETSKTLQTCDRLYSHLLEHRHDRDTTLIAVGGGVIGDLTGFVAATYQRGVAFIQVPTTLLSQVDSSVGGKTAVNHPLGKNMIGAFHQPTAVIADTDTLNSLPDRELSAGLAEVIKYGLIRDPDFLDWLETHMDALRARDRAALTHAILTSCRIKAEIVAADETEQGVRALLNLGHTFGHAIETEHGYGVWLHGEAVGTGMVMAAWMARYLGWLPAAEHDRVVRLVERAGLATMPPAGMTPERFRDRMAVDKKARGGRLRLILQTGPGSAVVSGDFPDEALQATLERFCTAASDTQPPSTGD